MGVPPGVTGVESSVVVMGLVEGEGGVALPAQYAHCWILVRSCVQVAEGLVDVRQFDNTYSVT